MPHNMTVTIEDPLWDKMIKHHEIRWSAIMKDAVKNKLEALDVLNSLINSNKLNEKEIEDFAVRLGKKITKRRWI